MKTINEMISTDEANIALLELQIAKLTAPGHQAQPGAYKVQVDVWSAALVSLRQGLEGLKLKHDSLIEAKSV